jgi:hypothetical protein
VLRIAPEIILNTIVSFSFYSKLQTILLSQNLSLKNLALNNNNNRYIQELSDSFIQFGFARPRVNKTNFILNILIIKSFRQFVCYIICDVLLTRESIIYLLKEHADA